MLHLREVPSSASCVQSDRGLFVVDLDEPNNVDEGRVQEGVCSECFFCRWVELACHLVCHVVSAHLLGVSAVGVLFN